MRKKKLGEVCKIKLVPTAFLVAARKNVRIRFWSLLIHTKQNKKKKAQRRGKMCGVLSQLISYWLQGSFVSNCNEKMDRKGGGDTVGLHREKQKNREG